MAILTRLLNALSRLGDSREAVAEELLFRLEEKTRANMDFGMDHTAAREHAMRTVGNRSLWSDKVPGVAKSRY